MNESAYVDQCPRTLRFTRAFGLIDPRGFDCYDRLIIQQGDLTGDLRIIGASHVVIVWQGGEVVLTEVLACVPEDQGTPIGKLLDIPVHDTSGPLDYMFEVELLSWEEGQGRVEELEERALTAGLVCDFPQGGLCAIPKTILLPTLEEGSFALITVHSYPGDGVVISYSTLTVREEACHS